jgi:hypothetical protein
MPVEKAYLLSSHKIVRLLRVVSAIPTATTLAMTALQHCTRHCEPIFRHCEPILRHCERSEAISISQNLTALRRKGGFMSVEATILCIMLLSKILQLSFYNL